MSRMKTFFTYFIIFVAFYIFTNVISYLYIQSTYSTLQACDVKTDGVKLEIEEGKSSYVSSTVKGNLTNTSEETIENKYVKMDFLTKDEKTITSKYIKIDKLEPGESMPISMRANAEKIKKVAISIVDKVEISGKKIFISDKQNGLAWLISLAILAHYFL